MFTLITDCDEFMKFKDKKKKLSLYFNKENGKIVTIDFLDDNSGGGFTIEYPDDLLLPISPFTFEMIDKEVLEFMKNVVITENRYFL